jgi:hypothetical protein
MRGLVKILRESLRLNRWPWTAVVLVTCMSAMGCANLGGHKDPPAKKNDPAAAKSDDAENSDSDDSHKIWGQLRPVDKSTSSTGLSDKSREIERDLGVQ